MQNIFTKQLSKAPKHVKNFHIFIFFNEVAWVYFVIDFFYCCLFVLFCFKLSKNFPLLNVEHEFLPGFCKQLVCTVFGHSAGLYRSTLARNVSQWQVNG